jgi:hypothetical protein
MDIFSSNLMSKLFKNFSSDQNLTIIDVGSADINGCYKSIVPQKWNYIGVDLCKAPNVDLEQSLLLFRVCFRNIKNKDVRLIIGGLCQME